jgi:hypothetical protein
MTRTWTRHGLALASAAALVALSGGAVAGAAAVDPGGVPHHGNNGKHVGAGNGHGNHGQGNHGQGHGQQGHGQQGHGHAYGHAHAPGQQGHQGQHGQQGPHGQQAAAVPSTATRRATTAP